MDALALALMSWASSHTGLPLPNTMPTFRFYDVCEIHRYAHDDGTLECRKGEGVQAVYDYHVSTVFLPDTWHPGDAYYVSMLLHELVHHMQAQAGINRDNVACISG